MDNRGRIVHRTALRICAPCALGKNGECWSILRADLEMKDMLSCRLVEIDKAQAPAGLAASYMSTANSTITVNWIDSSIPKVGKLARFGLPMIGRLYFQLQRHGLLENE